MISESQISKFSTSESQIDEMGSLCDWIGSILEKRFDFFSVFWSLAYFIIWN